MSQEPTSQEQIMTAEGRPFKTQHSADLTIQNKGLDASLWKVVAVEGGFAIQKIAGDVPKASGNETRTASNDAGKEKCYWVRFHNKSEKSQPDDVTLSVNTEVIKIKRNIKVCLPERYVECARNAQYPQFEQKPGTGRKIVGYVNVFPFDILGDATWSDYSKMRSDGDKATREDAQKHTVES